MQLGQHKAMSFLWESTVSILICLLKNFLKKLKGVKWKHSRLKSKLVEYGHYMFQNYAAGTVRNEMNCIIFFYKFYDIEVWDLPKVNDKNIQKPAPIYFKDLPDKEVIREAFQIASPLMKAIILFSCSSGCARTETLSLTIGDYIEALSEYLPRHRMDIFEVIDYSFLRNNYNI